MLATSTFAWFSMNRKVSVDGMQITATSSQSLVISDKTPIGSDIHVSYTSEVTKVIPVTHCDNGTSYAWYDAESGDVSTKSVATHNLIYNTNSENVSTVTGGEGSKALCFDEAVNGTSKYYVEYTVYLATNSQTDMLNQIIFVEFDDATKEAMKAVIKERDTKNALAIDFYLEEITSPSDALNETKYVKTLWACDANDDTLGKIALNASGINIPTNTATDKFVRITMRFYIDGDKDVRADVMYEVTNDVAPIADKTYFTKQKDDVTGEYTYSAQTNLSAFDTGVTYYEASVDGKYVYQNHVNFESYKTGVIFSVETDE